MSIGSDDLHIFFDEFADECKLPGGDIVNVIFDSVDSEAMGNRIVYGENIMMGKFSELGSLKKPDVVEVNGKSYQVQKVLRTDDGDVCDVFLSGAR